MKFFKKSLNWVKRPIYLIVFSACLIGQTYQVTGRILNESGKKLGPGKLVLYNIDKKKITEIEIANNGKFRLKNIPGGKYTVNLYGTGGYSTTENLSIAGKDVKDFDVTLTPSPDQVQISITPKEDGANLSWKIVPDALEYIIYRDNDEVARVKEKYFLDAVAPGKTFSYNIVALKNDNSKGVRSITEYGKSLMLSPKNIVTKTQKNSIKLEWESIENATGYAVYRDGEQVNITADNSYSDFELKFENQYSYAISTLDHHSDQGTKSNSVSAITHPQIAKPKSLKAESGENQVVLSWKLAKNSKKYYVYQNGTLVDSTENLKISLVTEAGTENCFSVAGVDQYGSLGPRSDAVCDKSVFSPPDSIIVTNDKRNNNLIEWASVEGASSYNLYANGKLQTNTTKTEIRLKGLKWDTQYSYYLTSLTGDGIEGPKSKEHKVKTPKIFFIDGLLLDENGDEKNVDQARVFLYDQSGTKLLEEFVVAKNGKFRFENEIIAGDYTIMAYGNGNGNGGTRVTIKKSDIIGLKIDLSTEGLVPEIRVERGVSQLIVHWSDIPQAKSYNIYKNDRLVKNIIGELSYLDVVAPGVPTSYFVRSIDLYDLEGPVSITITEKASYAPPDLSISIEAGGYAVDGSGRIINLSWPAVPGVGKYALYRDGELLSKQSELVYEEKDLKWNTQYIYSINSIDSDDIEGVNLVDTVITHPEVTAPTFKLEGKINSIQVSWDPIPGFTGKYKIFRDGGNIADLDALEFIDAVTPGMEYCYKVAAEDTFKTVGPDAVVACGKGFFAPPVNFNGKILRNTVSFAWEPVLAASGYRIYRDDKLIFDTPDATEFVDNDPTLKYDHDYMYEACSYDKAGDEGPKIPFAVKTHEEILAVDLITNTDLEKITLNWSRSNLKVDHRYNIYKDGELMTSTTDTIYDDYVPAGTFFCYDIKVIDKYNTEGPPSNSECAKVLVNYPKMLTVTGDVKKVIFNFKRMVGAAQYNIYMVDKETDSLSVHARTKQTYYEDKGLDFDTEYCYQVSSIDGDSDEGPKSPTMCGYVLPPPHITLIEKIFVESSKNNLLDGREHGWIIAKIVNDGRSPARELRPWLEPIGETMTPSLRVDSLEMIPILPVGDTLTINFPVYAKLKIESAERKFNIRVDEFTGMDLDPEPIEFQTLNVIPPNFVISDFGIDNSWGQNYIPHNEIVNLTVRFQNLSEGKSDSSTLRFRRDSSFTIVDEDEFYQFGLVGAGEYFDFNFEIMTKQDRFTVYIDIYDYFETRKTIPIHLETLKNYKSKSDLVAFDTPYPSEVNIGSPIIDHELALGIPKVSMDTAPIGIVLGNQNFYDSDIIGRSSIEKNVKIVRDYFHNLFGLEDHSIIPSQYWFFNNGISIKDFQDIFDSDLGFIKKKIESSLQYSGQSSLDVFLYFTGEGTTHNGEKCLIPFDADPTKDYSFYTIKEMYSNLEKIKNMPYVGEVTIFMDVDFNNPSFQQNLVKVVKEDENLEKKKKKKKKKKNAEEPVVKTPLDLKPPDGITAFYASNTTQLSYNHPETDNGIFTYYLLRGMKGEADNGDKNVTVAELHDYISKNVTDTTSKLYEDLPQVPQLFTSNPDRVLFRLP